MAKKLRLGFIISKTKVFSKFEPSSASNIVVGFFSENDLNFEIFRTQFPSYQFVF